MSEEKIPLHEAIFQDAKLQLKTSAGQNFEQVSEMLHNNYECMVRRYLGDDVPCYKGDRAYVNEAQAKARENFKRKMQASGRIPK
ncbi:MAG: hypothetical protein Q4G63_10000 [Bacteroidia bacterium]|nr:hypothetical protein [Bacteroidia bacterium]